MTDREKTLVERDRACVWHPYTQHATEPDPVPVVSAQDATLVLADGREIIDGISSWWTCLHGHGNPALIEAMSAQAGRLDHVLFAGATHEPAVGLAEDLLRVAPDGLTRVFYSDNGSTAVEVALKMAYARWVHRGEPERRVFVCLEGAYHGDTFGTMSVGDPDPFFVPFAPMLFEARRVPADAAAVRAALDELGPRAAGVVLEPLLQGAAGMRMQPTAFVQAVRGACDERGLPMIADEVLTGFGRTGTLFACERAGVAPDLLCLAKGLTGGTFPLAATLATEEIFASFLSTDRSRAFFHGHTFTAHPVGCRIARESLALCLANDVPAKLAAIGERIVGGLAPLGRHPRVRNLRQLGGVAAFDVEPAANRDGSYLTEVGPKLRAAAIERGVLLRPLGSVLYAMPPACTSDEQCDRIAAVLLDLAEVAAELTA